jgi:hypothetical protein
MTQIWNTDTKEKRKKMWEEENKGKCLKKNNIEPGKACR